MTIPVLDWSALAGLYCARQDCEPQALADALRERARRFEPEGFLLCECVMLDSSRLGELTVIPYGPRNSWKTIPQRPVSPRGLASDTSTVVGVLPTDALPPEAP